MDRQKKRAGEGDNVDYVLARTVRCILQYNAPLLSKRRGGGNQCQRGACFKEAIDMFSGIKMEGTTPVKLSWH
ncbi:unnamed protein product [Pylaiella littoralis]